MFSCKGTVMPFQEAKSSLLNLSNTTICTHRLSIQTSVTEIECVNKKNLGCFGIIVHLSESTPGQILHLIHSGHCSGGTFLDGLTLVLYVRTCSGAWSSTSKTTSVTP
jgi:hypothetical protein